MAAHSKFLELSLLDTRSRSFDISFVHLTEERRHDPKSPQTADPASTTVSSLNNKAMRHNQGSDALVDTACGHLSNVHAAPLQTPRLATTVGWGILPQRDTAHSSAFSIPRSSRSPPPAGGRRSAHHTREQRFNRPHHRIRSPSSTREGNMNLPLQRTNSTPNSDQINYHSPTEAAARALYPSGISRPLIAQQHLLTPGDRASTNQRLHDKYPGDVPVPFGYELYQCERHRSDGCWTDDGVQEGGLDAGMGPRKCFAKRVVRKFRKIGSRWKWGGERCLPGTGERAWILG